MATTREEFNTPCKVISLIIAHQLRQQHAHVFIESSILSKDRIKPKQVPGLKTNDDVEPIYTCCLIDDSGAGQGCRE